MADENPTQPPRAISVAIAALGGQGGGVLANWLVDIAENEGYFAQSTSVPGVAQRTGATVYYVEFFPRTAAEKEGKAPVLALMPVPGDVDVTVASEWVEAGRSIMRGFVTKKRTTLIASTHREYAIDEKAAMGSGIVDPDRIREVALDNSKKLVAFDMQRTADENGTVISAVLLGAVAGSGALPFGRDAFEAAIKRGGIAVNTNLKAFDAGFRKAEMAARGEDPDTENETPAQTAARIAPSETAKQIVGRIGERFPDAVQDVVIEGAKRCVDYQDPAYAGLYLDRLQPILELDEAHGGDRAGWGLTRETARYLALWMTIEDIIRVADLKTRKSRFERTYEEVQASDDQIVYMTEYMHPRIKEVAETMPVPVGKFIMNTGWVQKAMAPFFQKGRHMQTSKLSGFFTLSMAAALRPIRRSTLRYHEEKERIEAWLARIADAAPHDYRLAVELAECQRLVKGYSDTFERGVRNFATIMDALDAYGRQPNAAAVVHQLREAALQDEHGLHLRKALDDLNLLPQAAE